MTPRATDNIPNPAEKFRSSVNNALTELQMACSDASNSGNCIDGVSVIKVSPVSAIACWLSDALAEWDNDALALLTYRNWYVQANSDVSMCNGCGALIGEPRKHNENCPSRSGRVS